MEKPVLELLRIERTDESTIGVFCLAGLIICSALEEPWRDNEPNVSCFPEGEYELAFEYSPSFGQKLWTIKDVPGRSYIRIHIGNSVKDTEGCPLTITYPDRRESGERFGKMSRKAFDEFNRQMAIYRPERIIVRNV